MEQQQDKARTDRRAHWRRSQRSGGKWAGVLTHNVERWPHGPGRHRSPQSFRLCSRPPAKHRGQPRARCRQDGSIKAFHMRGGTEIMQYTSMRHGSCNAHGAKGGGRPLLTQLLGLGAGITSKHFRANWQHRTRGRTQTDTCTCADHGRPAPHVLPFPTPVCMSCTSPGGSFQWWKQGRPSL